MVDKGEKILHFKLAPGRVIWGTMNGSIKLNAFPDGNGMASIGGKVSSKEVADYESVARGIVTGALIKVSKKEAITPQKIEVKRVSDIKETQVKIDMATKKLLDMREEQAIIELKDMKHPALLTRILQVESKKKRRPKVIEAAKAALDMVQASSIIETVEEGSDIEATLNSDKRSGSIESSLEESF